MSVTADAQEITIGSPVGVVGLGIMGGAIARNLLKSGFRVGVFDINESRVHEIEAQGGEGFPDPRSLAQASDVLITVLPSTEHVQQVHFGPHGLFDGLKKATLCIECSTVSPVTAQYVAKRVHQKSCSLIDAGMSGSSFPISDEEWARDPNAIKVVVQARSGTMRLLIGGEQEDIARSMVVLKAISAEQVHCGPIGAGMVAKLANNMVLAATTVMLAEIMAWAKKNGGDIDVILDVLKGGVGDSAVLRNEFEKVVLKRAFEPVVFPLDYLYKDVREADDAAARTRTPMLVLTAVQKVLEIARAQGLGDLNYPVVLKTVEELAGTGPVYVPKGEL